MSKIIRPVGERVATATTKLRSPFVLLDRSRPHLAAFFARIRAICTESAEILPKFSVFEDERSRRSKRVGDAAN